MEGERYEGLVSPWFLSVSDERFHASIVFGLFSTSLIAFISNQLNGVLWVFLFVSSVLTK